MFYDNNSTIGFQTEKPDIVSGLNTLIERGEFINNKGSQFK